MDPLNQQWNRERRKLKDEIFRDLRREKDRDRSITLTGSFEVLTRSLINTNTRLVPVNKHFEIGAVQFRTRFQQAPNVSFGQVCMVPEKPILLFPYVKGWRWASGQVDGFTLGIYTVDVAALNEHTRESSYIPKHIITWRADGTASLYKDDQVYEDWVAEYDSNTPDALIIEQSDQFDI